ncbi:hypothetical protein [Nocardioides sp. SYSU D00065]|uniref:hypothetical protein n=1 Tax=Nocardioides sp. SYSU D00065 TaxID=2817378 RepID=UPI001B330C7B|nr:hypothetical protein [Nocardioides sp. SYSU D00065]
MVAATATWGVVAAVPAVPAAASVSIDAPLAPRAGTVALTGSVDARPGGTTTVLYVVDATRSTGELTGLDCAGDGRAGGVEDDLNGDGARGDVLDCEIAGVQALNRSLDTAPGTQVGLVAFADQAAAADLDPSGSATFVPPGLTGGEQHTRIDTVVRSVQRSRIGLYETRDLGGSGSGTAFNNAVSASLSALATAPPGDRWVVFLSDGRSGIDDSVLDALTRSGVRLRSFAIGSAATCRPSGSLHKMAAATGEACRAVASPADLALDLTGSLPDAVSSVTVTIGDVAVAATVGAVGRWRADFTLGAGTYTATVRATLASGAVRTAQRTFSVAPATGTADGVVLPAAGTLHATTVRVRRPQPSRAALPSRVTGRVGRSGGGFTITRALAGSRVRLQARSVDGDGWTTVARDRVATDGRFALRWRPRASTPVLRVELVARGAFAGSAAAVPAAPISACRVTGAGSGWTVTCLTTARVGSVVRLLDGRTVEDRSTVRRGTLRLHGRGAVVGSRVEVTVAARRPVRLTL